MRYCKIRANSKLMNKDFSLPCIYINIAAAVTTGTSIAPFFPPKWAIRIDMGDYPFC